MLFITIHKGKKGGLYMHERIKLRRIFSSVLCVSITIFTALPNSIIVSAVSNEQKAIDTSLEEATRHEDYFKYYHLDDTVRVIVELDKPSAIEKKN